MTQKTGIMRRTGEGRSALYAGTAAIQLPVSDDLVSIA